MRGRLQLATLSDFGWLNGRLSDLNVHLFPGLNGSFQFDLVQLYENRNAQMIM